MSFYKLGTIKDGAIADGIYPGTVASSEIKQSKAGKPYVSLKLDLGNGRVVTENLNLSHQDESVRERATATLTKILLHGYKNPPETLETMSDVAAALPGCSVQVKLKRKPDDGKYIGYYLDYQECATKADYSSSGSIPF